MVRARLARKASWAWWMLRYAVLDKHRDVLRVTAFWAATVVGAVCGVLLVLDMLGVRPLHVPGEPAQAWWVQLVLFLVSMLISWALRPKPEPPKPVEGRAPVVEDGAALERIYGTVWTDDGKWTAWANGDREPIRKKQGKK